MSDLFRRMRERAARAAEREEAAVDAAISDVVWSAQLDPESVPRIIRVDRVNVGMAYTIPGKMFPDGRSRCLVHPLQPLDEPGTIARLDEEDSRG